MSPVGTGRVTLTSMYLCPMDEAPEGQNNNICITCCLTESSQQLWFVQHATDMCFAHAMYQILFKELKIQEREDEKVSFGHEIKNKKSS